jgi:hypothetical protein
MQPGAAAFTLRGGAVLCTTGMREERAPQIAVCVSVHAG